MNPVIASITWRGALGRRRAILLFVFPALLLTLTILLSALGGDPEDWLSAVVGGLGIGAMIPILALIVGTSVLGVEIEDGNIVHVLTKPVPRQEIIITKLAVASAVTALFGAVPIVLATIIAMPGSLGTAFGLGVAALVGSIVYSAVFVMLSALTKRAVPIGLLYILIWENLLGGLAAARGVRALSVRQYTMRIAAELSDLSGINAKVGLSTAIVMSIVFTALATYFAIRKLRAFTIAGDVTA
ncbi:MAG TPA: ABC transporter permease [Actinomycetes bacterium]|nr:ABC transporter permease [Actinomycetes bacterium]